MHPLHPLTTPMIILGSNIDKKSRMKGKGARELQWLPQLKECPTCSSHPPVIYIQRAHRLLYFSNCTISYFWVAVSAEGRLPNTISFHAQQMMKQCHTLLRHENPADFPQLLVRSSDKWCGQDNTGILQCFTEHSYLCPCSCTKEVYHHQKLDGDLALLHVWKNTDVLLILVHTKYKNTNLDTELNVQATELNIFKHLYGFDRKLCM